MVATLKRQREERGKGNKDKLKGCLKGRVGKRRRRRGGSGEGEGG